MGRKFSEREEQLLEQMGAIPTVNSGASFGDGDGLIPAPHLTLYDYDGIAVEIKSTGKKQRAVSLEELRKISEQAGHSMPAFIIDFYNEKRKYGEAFVILTLDDFMALLREYYTE